MQSAQGNLEAALKAYGDGLAIFEKLAAQDPSNTGWQRDLSVSFSKHRQRAVAQGNLDDALEAYEGKHRIIGDSWRRRTRATPGGSATSRSASSGSATCSARGAI